MDDERANIRALERILLRVTRADLKSTTDPRTAAKLYEEFQPDLVLLDVRMPHLDGFGVLGALKRLIPAGAYVPIVIFDGEMTPESKQQMLSGGAKDFLRKPFDPIEIQLRITNLLETRALHVECDGWRRNARARIREVGGAQLETVERLAMAIEFREDGTGEHTKRVGQWSALLAEALGLPEANIMEIRLAAPLHDVGKIAIPDRILLKPGKLGPQEWSVMKAHTTIGAKMVSGARNSLLLTAQAIALNHHEKWDGSGYPRNLAAETIPLPARIVAVTDAFDAMTHSRPYRQALTEQHALSELERCAGTQFDPRCVEPFLRLIEDPGARSTVGLG